MKQENKKNNEDELKILIHSLSELEIQHIGKMLTLYSGRNDNLQLKLFQLLNHDRDNHLDIRNIIKKIYPGNKTGIQSYRMLRSRLKQRILDALINDSNLDRIKTWDELELVTIKLRKKLAQYYFLAFSRPDQPLVNQLLEEIITLSKNYELYPTILEALKYKKSREGIRYGEKQFDEINNQMQHYERCQIAVKLATDYYHKLSIKGSFSSRLYTDELNKFLQGSITHLREEIRITESAMATYFLLHLEISYYNLNEDFQNSKQACIRMLQLIHSNVSVYRKLRVGIANILLCESYVFLNEYTLALKYSIESQKCLDQSSLNYCAAKELEFDALYYSGKYQQAFKVIQFLLTYNSSDLGAFRLGKFSFFKANVLFKLGKIREALKAIRENAVLSQDKTGWDIGQRVFVILCMIELGNYDESFSALEALRKHIARGSKEKSIRERDRLIFKMLRALDANNYEFSRTILKQEKSIALLEGKDKAYRWEHFSHELFPFHEWMKSKAKAEMQPMKTAV